MTALAHTAFIASLRRFVQNGNAAESELAQIALDLYRLTDEHPGVVDYVNRKTLKVMDEK